MVERAGIVLGAGATGDPSLYIEPLNLAHAFLIDCGNHHLGHARLLRARFLFLSHTHLDHFIGFDSWMRVHLGSTNTLHVIGPPGTAQHVYHKIHGYVWNLAESVHLKYKITELEPLRSFELNPTTTYQLEEISPDWPEIDAKEEWAFRFASLQHLSIQSYGYRLFTRDQWRVDEEALQKSGLPPGSWLKEIKSKEAGDVTIGDKQYDIGTLRKELLYFAPGFAITYITDAVFHEENIPRMIELAADSDHFFCESSFLKEDHDRAARTHHLTTIQAATIAREAKVKQLHLFHFSRRYAGLEHLFLKEARSIFPRTMIGTRQNSGDSK